MHKVSGPARAQCPLPVSHRAATQSTSYLSFDVIQTQISSARDCRLVPMLSEFSGKKLGS